MMRRIRASTYIAKKYMPVAVWRKCFCVAFVCCRQSFAVSRCSRDVRSLNLMVLSFGPE